MSDIENGANPAANDTPVPAAEIVTDAPETETPELDENGEEIVPVEETEEVDVDGKKIVLPKDVAKAFKAGFLRQDDYTRKTQAVAGDRKAVDALRDQIVNIDQDHVRAVAKVLSIDDQLNPYLKLSQTDWANLHATDPNADAHWRNFQLLKDQRQAAAQAAGTAQGKVSELQREARAKLIETAQKEIPNVVPNWTPDLNIALGKYVEAEGIPQSEYAEIALKYPVAAKILNKARLYDESQAKAAKAAKAAANNAAIPAVEVGSKSPATVKDQSRMSTAEWMRWRSTQIRKKG